MDRMEGCRKGERLWKTIAATNEIKSFRHSKVYLSNNIIIYVVK